MEKRIYYHDTDSGGVVYHANYLKYLEEARTEFLEEKGLSVVLLQERGMIYAVRKCHIVYKSPARYGDTILCHTQLKDITAAQLIFEQQIRDKPTSRLLVSAQVTLVSLNREFQPTVIPEDLKACLL
jgi:acyl-CoA thioester hydrolase